MKKFINEFKEFISRGNVMDLAVGVIIGSAFTAIVTALVDNIVMPIVTIFTGDIDFSDWTIPLPRGGELGIGSFLSAVISFILVALVIFLMVKLINNFRRKEEPKEEAKHLCPYCRMEVDKEATRCPYCTSIIEAAPEDPAPQAAAAPARRQVGT